MNNSQLKHLEYILETLQEELATKYEKGAKEHDGDLLDLTALQLCNEAILENIDQTVYLLTLRKKLDSQQAIQS